VFGVEHGDEDGGWSGGFLGAAEFFESGEHAIETEAGADTGELL